MSDELRTAISRARFAAAEAEESLRNPNYPIPAATAIETLAGCVRNIGWRWQDIEALIAERDALAQQVQK